MTNFYHFRPDREHAARSLVLPSVALGEMQGEMKKQAVRRPPITAPLRATISTTSVVPFTAGKWSAPNGKTRALGGGREVQVDRKA